VAAVEAVEVVDFAFDTRDEVVLVLLLDFLRARGLG